MILSSTFSFQYKKDCNPCSFFRQTVDSVHQYLFSCVFCWRKQATLHCLSSIIYQVCRIKAQVSKVSQSLRHKFFITLEEKEWRQGVHYEVNRSCLQDMTIKLKTLEIYATDKTKQEPKNKNFFKTKRFPKFYSNLKQHLYHLSPNWSSGTSRLGLTIVLQTQKK